MNPVAAPAPASLTPLRPVGVASDPAAAIRITPPGPAPTRRPDPAKLRAKLRKDARNDRRDRLDR